MGGDEREAAVGAMGGYDRAEAVAGGGVVVTESHGASAGSAGRSLPQCVQNSIFGATMPPQ